MAVLAESVHEIGAPARRIAAVAIFTTVKSRVVDLWPPAIVAVGLGLSLVWTVGLSWLLYAMIYSS
jgi:hypothetical protein